MTDEEITATGTTSDPVAWLIMKQNGMLSALERIEAYIASDTPPRWAEKLYEELFDQRERIRRLERRVLVLEQLSKLHHSDSTAPIDGASR